MAFNLDDYVPVSERLTRFRDEHPEWGLRSEVLVDDGQRVLVKATITDQHDRVVATGHAEEVRGSGNVNKTAAVENAETSSWGRALAALGYEVKRGIASREEMQRSQPPPQLPEGWESPDQARSAAARLADLVNQFSEDQKVLLAEYKTELGVGSWPWTHDDWQQVYERALELLGEETFT